MKTNGKMTMDSEYLREIVQAYINDKSFESFERLALTFPKMEMGDMLRLINAQATYDIKNGTMNIIDN